LRRDEYSVEQVFHEPDIMLAGHGVVVNWLRSGLACLVLVVWCRVASRSSGRDRRSRTRVRGDWRWRWLRRVRRGRARVLGDAFDCADARFVSFRRSDAEPQIADQWYVASQLWPTRCLLHVASRQTGNGDPLTAAGMCGTRSVPRQGLRLS